MQKTLWFHEEQADVMLNYLPLRNVLIQGIKAMVKNKGLPDSARPCKHPRLVIHSLSFSLSPWQTWPYQGKSYVSSLSLSPTPFILRVSPGSCRGWTPARRLPRCLSVKEFACQCRRHEFNPWVRKIPWKGNSNILQYSCLENPMDREAWQATVHGVAVTWNLGTEHNASQYD